MISDPNTLKKLQQEWEGVRALRNRIKLGMVVAAVPHGYPFILSNMAHNLPFLHACGVLNNVLEQLRDENLFKCGSKTLGSLLDASQYYLPWNDFVLMKEILDQRNKLAHHGHLILPSDCRKYIEAIEHELVTWKIVNLV
jgi:hypothetical protein